MFALFFDFDDLGILNDNYIVREAFEQCLFSKLILEGYTDINPLIGKPRITKSEMENKLRKINSPLARLYAGAFPKSNNDIEENMLPVLNELEQLKKDGHCDVDDFSYFSIVYYIFQRYKSMSEKLNFIIKIYEEWNKKETDYNIKISNGIVYDALNVDVNFVSSVTDYVKFIRGFKNNDNKIFFRGHSNVSYDLQPSLFRKKEWLINEKKMYLELMSRCPYEFEKLNSHIEKLAEMQHYGLPTRLLDITQNPLVALFFACEMEQTYRGEVIVFEEDKDDIKYSQSDTVALLASLPLFTINEQKDFYKASRVMGVPNFHFENEVERLAHEIRLERPGFISKIEPTDIRNAIVCIPNKKNRRIDNQEGAFIVCGLFDEIYGEKKGSTLSCLRVRNSNNRIEICIIENKLSIIKELDDLGINKARIYPEIDDVADYIKTHIEQI